MQVFFSGGQRFELRIELEDENTLKMSGVNTKARSDRYPGKESRYRFHANNGCK